MIMIETMEELIFTGGQLTDFSNAGYFLFKFGINIFFTFIIMRIIFFPVYKERDYVFACLIINVSVFIICYMLANIQLKMGFAFGLFAVFSILRYRTEQIQIRQMTYLFAVIIIAVLNALTDNASGSLCELIAVNCIIMISIYVLEKNFLHSNEIVKLITYEKIDLIKPENYKTLIKDLKERTGFDIKRAEVESINFLNDTAKIKIIFVSPELNLNKVD